MCDHADWERDAVADELVTFQTQLDEQVQGLAAKQAEWDRFAQHASDDIKEDAVPLLFDDATSKEMVKLK
jgi:hypothetical protein